AAAFHTCGEKWKGVPSLNEDRDAGPDVDSRNPVHLNFTAFDERQPDILYLASGMRVGGERQGSVGRMDAQVAESSPARLGWRKHPAATGVGIALRRAVDDAKVGMYGWVIDEVKPIPHTAVAIDQWDGQEGVVLPGSFHERRDFT